MRQRTRRYRCPHCGKLVRLDSDKQWVTSWCETMGRPVRLQLVKKR
jgi:DNA-directed RNA polymerase subunit RPC12/RpoP